MMKKKETQEEFYARIEKYSDKQDIVFVDKKNECNDIFSFMFRPAHKVQFMAGMFAHVVIHGLTEEAGKPVRYFSIASAPYEENLMFTTHVREKSMHKQKLGALSPGDSLSIYKVKGEFVLPDDQSRPVVLIAGGIGITPFRSMMRQALHERSKRGITLVHISDDEYVYENELSQLPYNQHRIRRERIDEYMQTLFEESGNTMYYFSGPPSFVDSMKERSLSIGINENDIKQDWFDGYDDF
jgi:ferredoxin-NADP reductase